MLAREWFKLMSEYSDEEFRFPKSCAVRNPFSNKWRLNTGQTTIEDDVSRVMD